MHSDVSRGITLVLVKKLKRIITTYDGRLNETATRYCLVDPVLRDLGWHLDNPSECEYELGPVGRYDYGLGRRILIEAKRLGGVTERDERQLRDYLRDNGMRHGVLTDGRRWLKMTVGPDTYHEDFRVDVMANPYNVVVQRLQGLERSVIFDMVEEAPAVADTQARARQAPDTDAQAPAAGVKRGFEQIDTHKPSSRVPYAVRFDDVVLPAGSSGKFANFSRAYVGVVEHLFERGLLTEESIRSRPLDAGGRGKTILLSAYRPPGNLHRARLKNGMWLNVNFNTICKHRQLLRILKAAGCDPRRILVSSG